MHCAAQGLSGWRTALYLLIAFTAAGQSDDLARKSARVKDLMAAGDFAAAVPLCRELVSAMPANPGLHLNLGLALQMSGHGSEAIPEFEFVLKSQPDSFPALVSLGMARLENRDPAAAVRPLEKAVALAPTDVSARGMLAGALFALGRTREAAVHYRKLTALTPDDPKAWHGLGQSYESLSTLAFEQLSKSGEGSPEWLSLVADSRVVRRQFRSAFFFYQQALEKRPGFRPAVLGIADVYQATNHADWAAAEKQKLKSLPAPDCRRDKGACDFAAGRYQEAAASSSPYWRARAYNELARQAFAKLGALPASVELYSLLAELAQGRRQYMEAADHWGAALKLAPGDARLEQQLAMALQQAGDYQKSLPMFEAMLRQHPRSPELNFFVGEAHLRLEEPDKAMPYLEAALRLNPDLTGAHASLGLVYMRSGKAAEAIPHLEAALESDDDGSLHFQLARAYRALGKPDRAKAAMEQYQAIQKRSEAEKHDIEEKSQITAPQ